MKHDRTSISRNTHLRKVMVSIVALCCLVIIIVILSVSILNSSWGIQLVQGALTGFLGREVTLSSLEVNIGRIVTVRVGSPWLANSPWASEPFFMKAKGIYLEIDTFKVLRGNLTLTKLAVVSPVVNLERSSQAIPNWTFEENAAPEENSDDYPEQHQRGVLVIPQIDSLLVDDGQIRFLDQTSHTSIEFLFESQMSSIPGRKNRLVATGWGTVQQEPVKINFTLGLPPGVFDKGPRGLPLHLSLDSGDTTLSLDGKIHSLFPFNVDTLQFTLVGKNLSRWNGPFNLNLPAFPTFAAKGLVQLQNNVWSLHHLKASIADSDLEGQVRFAPLAHPVRIEANLKSKRLNAAELQTFMPRPSGSGSSLTTISAMFSTLAHNEWEGHLTYQAGVIHTEGFPINDVTIRGAIVEQEVRLDTLSVKTKRTGLQVNGRLSAEKEVAEGHVQIRLKQDSFKSLRKDNEKLSTGAKETSDLLRTLNGEWGITFKANYGRGKAKAHLPEQAGNSMSDARLVPLVIQDVKFQYKDLSSSNQIVVRLNEPQAGQPANIEAAGMFRRQPVKLRGTLPSLGSFFAAKAHQQQMEPFAVDLTIAEASLGLRGRMMPSLPPANIDMHLDLRSTRPTRLAKLFGIELRSLGPLKVDGQIQKRTDTWNIAGLNVALGESDLHGKAVIKGSNTLVFNAAFQSQTIQVGSHLSKDDPGEKEALLNVGKHQKEAKESPSFSSIEISIPRWLKGLNGKVSLAVRRLVLPAVGLNKVSAVVTFQDGRVQVSPFTVGLERGTVHASANLNVDIPALAGHFRMDIEAVSLDTVATAFGHDGGELGTINGRIHLRLPRKRHSSNLKSLTVDSILERIRIAEVHLLHDNPALQANTDLRVTADGEDSRLQINGKMTYRDTPIQVSLTTGSFHRLVTDFHTMPLAALARIKDTTIGVRGCIQEFFPLDRFTGTMTAEGPNTASLGEILDIPFPSLPPYRLQAQIRREPGNTGSQVFHVQHLQGTIGDSDIQGDLRIRTGDRRPKIFARLTSKKLDFDDLAGLVGGAPDPEETASANQKAEAELADTKQTVIPDKPLDFSQLRRVDADVIYRAKGVKSPGLPLDDFLLKFNLKDGRLQIDRLNFGVADGTIANMLLVDVRNPPVQAKLSTEFDEVNLNELLAPFEVADDSFGNIGGKATLWFKGDSLARWLASADGGLYLTMTGGKIDALLVELAGLDFSESVAVFLSTDTGVTIECAYTDFHAREGQVTIQPFLLDTKDTKFKGFGTLDLARERLDLTVHPYPKDFSFLSSRGPLHIRGTLKNPDFNVDPSFPLPEFGTAQDSERCLGMVEAIKATRKARTDQFNEVKSSTGTQ